MTACTKMMLAIVLLALSTLISAQRFDFDETILQEFPFDLHQALYGYPVDLDFPLYVLNGTFEADTQTPYTAVNSRATTYFDLNITRIVDNGIDFDTIIEEGNFTEDEKQFIVMKNFSATAVWGTLGNLTDMEFAGIILSFLSVVEGNKTVSMVIPQVPVTYYTENITLFFSTCEDFSARCDDKNFDIDSDEYAACVAKTTADCQNITSDELSKVDEAAVDGQFGEGTTAELRRMYERGESIQNFLADKAAAIIVAQLTRGCVQCAIKNEMNLTKPSIRHRQLCSQSCHPWSGCAGRTIVSTNVVVINISIVINLVGGGICKRLLAVTIVGDTLFVIGNIKKDPHVTTFDGLKYECQARGHFTLAKSLYSPFEVQARMRKARAPANAEPGFDDGWGNSVINGVALMVGDEPVVQISEAVETSELSGALLINMCPISFYVGDAMRTLHDGISKITDEVTVDFTGSHIAVNIPSKGVWVEIEVELSENFGCLLDVNVVLSDSFKATNRIEGLLGSPDGDKTNDWMDRNGEVLNIPEQNALGHVIDDDKSRDYCTTNWCVEDEGNSLFIYPAGGSLSFGDLNRCSTVGHTTNN